MLSDFIDCIVDGDQNSNQGCNRYEAPETRYRGHSQVWPCNEVRAHLSLKKDAPIPRDAVRGGRVLALPISGWNYITDMFEFEYRSGHGNWHTAAVTR